MNHPDWKAPVQDGQLIIWPGPGQILVDVILDQRRLRASDARVQNIPLSEVRRRQRGWIGHKDDAQPLIATGHQTELYHPGVWVKDILTNALAQKSGGAAYHFAVDTDSPKHLYLRWPGAAQPITDDTALNDAAWTGLLAPPTPQHLSYVAAEFDDAAADWSFEPSIEPFFSSVRRLALEPGNLSSVLTNSIHRLEWELGLRHHALITSPMWMSEPFLVYAHDILARAEAFVGTYNGALAEYRRDQGIRTPSRPMPDLRIDDDVIESPFWLDSVATGDRKRAALSRRGTGRVLTLENGDEFIFDTSADGWDAAGRFILWLRRNGVRLAPRALTLTMFFRLLLADHFVHGIGGGRYDQVTDRIIERHFGIAPPRFSVTTATLYFPTAAGQRRIDLHPLWQESRRIRHGMLSSDKRNMVEQIALLPRRSMQRRELFFKMHAKLASESNSPVVREAERRLRDAEHESAAQRAIFDRELFFAIQPVDRLKDLMTRYDAAIAAASTE